MRATTVAREIFNRIADKWVLLVINALGDGTPCFTELRARVDGISQKMLTQTVRSLERDGIVERTVFPTVPPRVDYTLTPAGFALLRTVTGICAWTAEHLLHIEASRARFDTTRSSG